MCLNMQMHNYDAEVAQPDRVSVWEMQSIKTDISGIWSVFFPIVCHQNKITLLGYTTFRYQLPKLSLQVKLTRKKKNLNIYYYQY